MMEFAICEGCFKRTLSPQLSLEGDKTLCPECAKAERDYWDKYYSDQQALEELYRKAESDPQ